MQGILTIVAWGVNLFPDVSHGKLTHVQTDSWYRWYLIHMVNVLDVIGIYDTTYYVSC